MVALVSAAWKVAWSLMEARYALVVEKSDSADKMPKSAAAQRSCDWRKQHARVPYVPTGPATMPRLCC
jgi:hypothetical protein